AFRSCTIALRRAGRGRCRPKVSPIIDRPPSELCLIRLSAIGDTCHTVPVVRAIQRAAPSTRITWIVGAVEHRLLEGLEGVEFIVYRKAHGLAAPLAVRRALGGRRFPVLLHMHASMRANLASLAVRRPPGTGSTRPPPRAAHGNSANPRTAAAPNHRVLPGLLASARATGPPRG